MKMNKEKIKKDDGRYLIYYTFNENEEDRQQLKKKIKKKEINN